MPLVGAVAAPHSHLQLFTRPAENEKYKEDVQKGRKAMIALRAQVERAKADTILVIHDDHFVNFDFRCYPPFALFVGQEAKGSGVTDPIRSRRSPVRPIANTRARRATSRRRAASRSTWPTGRRRSRMSTRSTPT